MRAALLLGPRSLWMPVAGLWLHCLVSHVCSTALPRVRVVNGTDDCSGRVEVHRSRQWWTVCDRSWDLRDAQVACRELGCGAALDAVPGAHFGRGGGQVLADAMRCAGNEQSLTECETTSGHPGCLFHGGAGIICARKSEEAHSGARLRLGNGLHECSGRVEVYQAGHWGKVCDDDWDLDDARVVCRELGCGAALNATKESSFGIGVGMPVVMDNVWCTGTEGSLLDCPSLAFWQHNCAHNEEAGVVCAADVAAGRSLDGLYTNFQDTWPVENNTMSGSSYTQETTDFYSGSGDVASGQFMNDIPATQNDMVTEAYSGSSSIQETTDFYSGSGDVASGQYANDILNEIFRVRLANGSDGCTGRLEVYYSGQWGTVCDDSWDLSDASVACRELGCGTAVEALGQAWYGQGTGPVVLERLECSGSEQSLLQCPRGPRGTQSCGHLQDAAVVCSASSH